MKCRERFPFDEHARNEKPVVAVLLTCGLASRFPEFGNIKYKALLPLKGLPIVDFVSTALCNSQVEKVFVVHAPDEDIKKALTQNEKIVFAECSQPNPALTDSGMCSLKKLFEYYGENELNEKLIMFVPCDIPLVKAQDFNALIYQTFNNDADYCPTVIRNSLLKEDEAGRHFRKIHLNELGDDYSVQPINFIRSRLFQKPKADGGLDRTSMDDSQGSFLDNLLKIIDDVRKNRHSIIGWVRFAYRIAGKGGMILSFQLLSDLLRNRITESKFGRAVHLTLNVKVAVLESQSAAFSLDIDTPDDFNYVSRLTGL